MPKRIIALVTVLVAMQSACQPDSSNRRVTDATGDSASNSQGPNLGLVMVSAFQCSTYAELAKDSVARQRLFNIGLTAGRRFLKGIEDGTTSENDLKGTPWTVLGLIGGPSIDFMIGRVFEWEQRDAYDDVVMTDNAGRSITNPADRITDEEIRVSKAKLKYLTSNCAALGGGSTLF